MPTAVDSSVLLDVLLADPQHAKSSEAALREAMAQDGLVAGGGGGRVRARVAV